MRLFIRLNNGVPFEHPIMEDNFQQVYPDIDLDNLSSEFIEFKRKPIPILNIYEKNISVTYKIIDGYCTDVFSWYQMTEMEKLEVDQHLAEELKNQQPTLAREFNIGVTRVK